MDDIFGIFSFIVLGAGVYGFYAFFKTKKDGHINGPLLLGKNYNEYACKDIAGFIQKTNPALLIFAIISTAYGLIDVVHYYVTPMPTLDMIGLVVFVIMIIGFGAYTVKIKNEYFNY